LKGSTATFLVSEVGSSVLDPVKKKKRTGGGRSQPEEDGLLRRRADRETVYADSERIETPFYCERRVIGRRQLDGRNASFG